MNNEYQHMFSFDQGRIKEVLFPVMIRDVFVATEEKSGEDDATTTVLRQAPRHKAVVDDERNYVFAMVTDNYDLITNQQAIRLGEACFDTVFSLLKSGEMILLNVIMPATRSFCHIDFVHSEARFNYFDKDPWSPFLRITNSYNRTHLLRFDLGFCRGVCKNGLIFGKHNIEFKFTHSKLSARDPEAEFSLKAGDFLEMEAEFRASIVNLRRFHVPRKFVWPLACKVFEIRKPGDKASRQKIAVFNKRKEAIEELASKYFEQLGENGYAALNVLTDYATRPPAEFSAEQRINGLQTASGVWMQDFVTQIESRDFDFVSYLGRYAELAA